MISIKQSPSRLAALGGRCACLLALLSAACGDKPAGQETDTLVRPATSAPAKLEDTPEPPLPAEGGEIPKGVSPPEPSADEARAQAPSEGELPRGQSAPEPAPAAQSGKAAKAPASPPKKAATPSSTASPRPAAPKVAPTLAKSKPNPKPAASSPQPSAATAAPIAAAPEPQPVAAPKRVTVQVPSTEHVRVDVPAGLQGWLDADDRMRPWLGKAIAVADSCYAKVRADNPSASGEIAVQVTMHENARPSGRVASAAPAVSGITMCATTRLLGVKMPLFTGREGETYTVRVRFSP